MSAANDQLLAACERQRTALNDLRDEIMSILHAQSLRGQTVASETVIAWLRGMHDMVQEGMDLAPHFGQPTIGRDQKRPAEPN
jgi:hypothetical protein